MGVTRRGGRRMLQLAGGLLLAGSALVVGAHAGDPVMARSHVESAKDAIEQKKYDTALALLTKARAEDAELLDVTYWEALAQEKRGDAAAALRAYRTFRDAAGIAQARAALTKELDGLLKKAQARVAALAPGEAEEARLRSGLAGELLGIVKSKEAKDRAAAAIAVEALLRAYPDHAEARQALARLTVLPLRQGEFPLPAPLQAIGTWNDMIANTPFGSIAEWTYVEPGLRVEGSRCVGAAEPLLVKDDCAFDLELRLVATKSADWHAGWRLNERPAALNCGFREGTAAMSTGVEGGRTAQPVEARKVAELVPGVWHRLSVLVEQKKVHMWVDGGKPIVHAWPALTPNTELALDWHDCTFEMRTFRWARTR